MTSAPITLTLTDALTVHRHTGSGRFARVRLAKGTAIEVTMGPSGARMWSVAVAGREYVAAPWVIMEATG